MPAERKSRHEKRDEEIFLRPFSNKHYQVVLLIEGSAVLEVL